MINLKKRRNTRILIILISIFAIALIGFLITFYFTINSGNETQEQNNENEQTQGAIRNLQEETIALNKQYNDVVGWLRISGTSIDTAIYQADNNDRYLRNDKDNKETRWGENFLDYRCDINKINEPMQHYIIYGHNTEVDTRFTPLFNYKDEKRSKIILNVIILANFGLCSY